MTHIIIEHVLRVTEVYSCNVSCYIYTKLVTRKL